MRRATILRSHLSHTGLWCLLAMLGVLGVACGSDAGALSGSGSAARALSETGAPMPVDVVPDDGPMLDAGASPAAGPCLSPAMRTADGRCATWRDVSLHERSRARMVWGSSSSDVWVVGERGTIRHWNGTAWSPIESATTMDIKGIWGSAASDVWAVGVGSDSSGFEGTVIRWNGTAWRVVALPAAVQEPLQEVWGSSDSDIWAVGLRGGLLHWDGTAWTKMGSGISKSLLGVWGNSASDVWAVGEDGLVVRFSP